MSDIIEDADQSFFEDSLFPRTRTPTPEAWIPDSRSVTDDQAITIEVVRTPTPSPASPLPSRRASRPYSMTPAHQESDAPIFHASMPAIQQHAIKKSMSTSLVPCSSITPVKSTSSKAATMVQLIFQSNTGAMNFSNPVPSSVLRESTVVQFFNKYSQISGTPLHELSTLKFSIVFANNETLVVDKWSREDQWRILKIRIRNLLKDTQAVKPRLTDFEVWVKAGDNIALQAMDDDDLDGL